MQPFDEGPGQSPTPATHVHVGARVADNPLVSRSVVVASLVISRPAAVGFKAGRRE